MFYKFNLQPHPWNSRATKAALPSFHEKLHGAVAHSQGAAEKLTSSHAVSMLPIRALHTAICQGQLFHRRVKKKKESGLQPHLSSRIQGNEKAEVRLTSVIGLLASSHAAWLTCLWSIPGTFTRRTKTPPDNDDQKSRGISASYWQTGYPGVSDVRPLMCTDRCAQSLLFAGGVIFKKPGAERGRSCLGLS